MTFTSVLHTLFLIVLAASVSPPTSAVSNYWSTTGTKIVDSSGTEIFYSGVNWDGFEAQNCIADGLWLNITYNEHLQNMANAGFNLIRLPFAGTCMQRHVYPKAPGISSTNQDLKGLTTFEAMKTIIEAANTYGIKVILDYHRRDVTDLLGTPEDGLWFNQTFPLSYFYNTWKSVAKYLINEPNIVGINVFNEPRGGAVWTNNGSDPYDFYTVAKSVGDAIHRIQPNWLIMVEGVDEGKTWWGEDLSRVKALPLKLRVPNKVLYAVHDYGPALFPQEWFFTSNFPTSLGSFWETYWGFVFTEGIGPVAVMEIGSNLTASLNATIDTLELEWLNTLVAYIKANRLSWAWFTWGPNAATVGGILSDDWSTLREDKLNIIAPIFYPNFKIPAAPAPVSAPNPPLSFSYPPPPPPSPVTSIIGSPPPPPPSPKSGAAMAAPSLHGLLAAVVSLVFCVALTY